MRVDDFQEELQRVTGLPVDFEDAEPPPTHRARPAKKALAAFDPGRRGLRAIAVVAGLVVCIAAFLVWRSRPQTIPVPLVPASAPVAAASSAPSFVVVSVGGRVARPGLVRLPAGARVADAIDAAGGALPGTDLSYVNLARKVVDGEMILVGVTPPPGVPTDASSGDGGGLVNINTATATQLETLPGIGAVLAQKIIDYRTAHGGFKSVDDLRQVPGIGDAKFAQIKALVTV